MYEWLHHVMHAVLTLSTRAPHPYIGGLRGDAPRAPSAHPQWMVHYGPSYVLFTWLGRVTTTHKVHNNDISLCAMCSRCLRGVIGPLWTHNAPRTHVLCTRPCGESPLIPVSGVRGVRECACRTCPLVAWWMRRNDVLLDSHYRHNNPI